MHQHYLNWVQRNLKPSHKGFIGESFEKSEVKSHQKLRLVTIYDYHELPFMFQFITKVDSLDELYVYTYQIINIEKTLFNTYTFEKQSPCSPAQSNTCSCDSPPPSVEAYDCCRASLWEVSVLEHLTLIASIPFTVNIGSDEPTFTRWICI